MRTADDLLSVGEAVVAAARREGAEEAEAFLWSSEGAGAMSFGGLLYPKSYDELGLAARVALPGGKVGLGCVMGAHGAAQQAAVRQALAIARARPPDPRWQGFADPARPTRGAGAWDPRIEALTLDDILEGARDLHARADAEPEVRFASANDHAYRFRIAVVNTRGVQASDGGTVHTVRVEARAGRGGRERSTERSWFSRGPLPQDGLAEHVASEARRGLATEPMPVGTRDVVFAPETSWALGFLLAHALNGRRVALGQTPLAGRVGEQVFAEALTVTDDVAAPGGIRTLAVDDEGVPAQDTPVVERGVLRGFLWDVASGRAAGPGGGSTGNGVRGIPRYFSVPSPWPMNLAVAPGRGRVEDLVAGVEDGVLVRGAVMGLNQSQLVSGDFSLVAPDAWRIRRGEVTHALPRTTLAGNVHACLGAVRAVGADVYLRPGFAMPSMRVGGITSAT